MLITLIDYGLRSIKPKSIGSNSRLHDLDTSGYLLHEKGVLVDKCWERELVFIRRIEQADCERDCRSKTSWQEDNLSHWVLQPVAGHGIERGVLILGNIVAKLQHINTR